MSLNNFQNEKDIETWNTVKYITLLKVAFTPDRGLLDEHLGKGGLRRAKTTQRYGRGEGAVSHLGYIHVYREQVIAMRDFNFRGQETDSRSVYQK